MNCTFQVCEWKKTYENKLNTNNWIITAKNLPCSKEKYSFLSFQGQFGLKKESDDDDAKSKGTSNSSKHRVCLSLSVN